MGYGFYKEGLVAVVHKGFEGQQEIAQMMIDYRNNPPKTICGSAVNTIIDYQSSESTDLTTGKKSRVNILKSNVLQFLTADRTIISVRPSGTEPKIKFYFGVCEPIESVDKFDDVNKKLDEKIEQMKKEMKLV